MPYVFNPFTGNLDYSALSGSTTINNTYSTYNSYETNPAADGASTNITLGNSNAVVAVFLNGQRLSSTQWSQVSATLTVTPGLGLVTTDLIAYEQVA